MRADANEVVDVGRVADAADDIPAELRAPGIYPPLSEDLLELLVHLRLGQLIRHEHHVGDGEGRGRRLQQKLEPLDPCERKHVKESALVRLLVLPPQETDLHDYPQRRLVPPEYQRVLILRHLRVPLGDGDQEIVDLFRDETHHNGEYDEAEDDERHVHEPQSHLIGDGVVHAGRDDQRKREVDAVRPGVGAEDVELRHRGPRREVVVEQPHKDEHDGGEDDDELERIVGIGGDAILELVPEAVEAGDPGGHVPREVARRPEHLLLRDAGILVSIWHHADVNFLDVMFLGNADRRYEVTAVLGFQPGLWGDIGHSCTTIGGSTTDTRRL